MSRILSQHPRRGQGRTVILQLPDSNQPDFLTARAGEMQGEVLAILSGVLGKGGAWSLQTHAIPGGIGFSAGAPALAGLKHDSRRGIQTQSLEGSKTRRSLGVFASLSLRDEVNRSQPEDSHAA